MHQVIIELDHSMSFKRITIEHIIYLVIIVLAIGIRVLRIDQVPLSDYEATRAVQALRLSQGDNTELIPGPAYPILTGMTFFLFADTNGYARLWPIIGGICLVIFPYFIRSLIGRKAALIMTLGLAISPSLVAYSRLAGADILAVGFGMLAIGLIVYRKPIPAGIFAGFALLSGPIILQGIASLGLALILGYFVSKTSFLIPLNDNVQLEIGSRHLWTLLFTTVITILAMGTLFLIVPTGLGSVASIIPAYLRGWVELGETGVINLLANLVIYNPVLIIFGLVAVVNVWRYRNTFGQWLSIWAGISFLLAIIYPGKDIFSWLWFLVPMWALASLEIAKYFRLKDAEVLPAIGQAFLILLLMALGWLNLAGLNLSGVAQETDRWRWAIIGGTVFLGGITTLLIALGWSRKTAQQGLAWGLLLGFGFYGFSLMWGVSQLRPTGELELIGIPPVSRNTGDFQETLGDLSEWRTGMRESLDVIVTSAAPSLMWELRKWDNAKFLSSVPNGELPPVIISSADQPEPNQSMGYRGQDFSWWVSPAWNGVLPDNWARWLAYREAPLEIRNIILWARLDLFPGGVISEVKDIAPDKDDLVPVGSKPVE
jgi:hypothetical protein